MAIESAEDASASCKTPRSRPSLRRAGRKRRRSLLLSTRYRRRCRGLETQRVHVELNRPPSRTTTPTTPYRNASHQLKRDPGRLVQGGGHPRSRKSDVPNSALSIQGWRSTGPPTQTAKILTSFLKQQTWGEGSVLPAGSGGSVALAADVGTDGSEGEMLLASSWGCSAALSCCGWCSKPPRPPLFGP